MMMDDGMRYGGYVLRAFGTLDTFLSHGSINSKHQFNPQGHDVY
jgi:hypothetical protein